MIKKSFLIILLIISMNMNAQNLMTKIEFSDNEHNFGVFKEETGVHTFDFVVTNTGNQPLYIQKVTVSCGCTTPEWTKQPIPAGGKGKITAIYNPLNKPGTFNETLTVYSNTIPTTTTLTIKGEVIPYEEQIVGELFTFPVGSIRFKSNRLEFTNVKKTEVKGNDMQIINRGEAPVKVEFDLIPIYLKIKAEPEILQPGQQGRIVCTYDANLNPGWGYLVNAVRIKLNGVPQEKAYMYVSANLVEDFSYLSEDELANAPIFKLLSNTFNLGKIKGATEKEVEFKFTNEGKKDLVIRHIKSTCGCTAIQQESHSIIPPGESNSIKALFNSGNYKGKVTKEIFVYTNDPKNSEVVLMINADIEQTAIKK